MCDRIINFSYEFFSSCIFYIIVKAQAYFLFQMNKKLFKYLIVLAQIHVEFSMGLILILGLLNIIMLGCVNFVLK